MSRRRGIVTTPLDWAATEEFGALCDLVASEHLVCITGAGISREMLRKRVAPGADPKLPGWIALLRELLDGLEPKMSPADFASAQRLLSPDDERLAARSLRDAANASLAGTVRTEALSWLKSIGPSIGSQELILAASLIRRADPEDFERRFREAITEAPGQYSDTHLAIAELLPRGIVTFNYDGGHEAACARQGRGYLTLNPTDPTMESRFGELLGRHLQDFFLLKMHGSADSAMPLVLTTVEYRNLLAKNPAFRSFVQNLFTNFNFLMVGYGLDDPDFDLFLRTMAEQFGDPFQEHVVLRTAAQRHRREEVERLLYGIRTLHVNDHSEIPTVLRLAASTPGPVLKAALDLCLSCDHGDRRSGHAKLATLGPAGRAVAGRVLLGRLEDHDSFVASEAAYSLGLLDPSRYKERLCRLVETRAEADVVGRTLTVLRGVLDVADLPRVAGWAERFKASPPTGERPERIGKYLDYLLVYIEHKYLSDPVSGSP